MRKSQINLKELVPLFLTTSLAVMYFVIQKTFFPPYGRYSSYNTFVIDGWQQRLSDFSTFLLVDTAGFLIALVTFSTLRGNEEKVSFLKQFVYVTAYSLILFLSSCLPHVFVGKSVSLFKIDDWEGRYALSLAIALAISFGLFLKLSLRNQNHVVKSIQLIITAPLIVGLAWLSIYGFAYKLNQQLFFREFIVSLQNYPDQVPPGLVEISANGVPGPDIRTYEYNVLFQEAYGGNPNWYVGNELPLWPQNQQNYYFMDVYIPHEESCITKMDVIAKGFIGNKAIFGNILPLGTKGTISVAIQDIDCNGN